MCGINNAFPYFVAVDSFYWKQPFFFGSGTVLCYNRKY